MSKVSRFLALLLGASAFVPSYSSQAADKYKSNIKKTDNIGGMKRQKMLRMVRVPLWWVT